MYELVAALKSYNPLYLKHRPQSLGDLVGQSSVVKTLTNAIENNRVAHAYLFTGPRGCGKTSSARILAKSLNCENGPTPNPCLTCTTCIEITAGNSPAVFEIDAASNNSVDDARVLIERAPLVAQGGRFKLYIIDECHMLTKEAFNALLKTIEEPPENVIFILATTEEHKVPPTIISRCQRLMFRLANHKDLSQHLRNVAEKENISILDEAIELIARRSGGGLRDALGLLDQASLLSTPEKPVSISDLLSLLGAIDEDVLVQISEGIRDRDGSSVLIALHSLLSQGREPSLVALELSKHFLSMAKALHLGDKKLSSADGEMPLINQLISGTQNYIDQVIKLAPAFDGSELTQIVEQLDRLETNLRRSTQPALTLEVGLLSICHRHDILMVRELSTRVEQLEAALSGGAPAPYIPATPQPRAAAPAPSHTPAPAYSPPPAVKPAVASAPVSAPSVKPEISTTAATTYGAAKDQDRLEEKPRTEPTAEQQEQPRVQQQEEPDHSEQIEEAPAVAKPAPVAVSSSSMSHESTEEIDEFWSKLMDHLQQKSIPTFSIVNQHGFALSLKDDEFVIGVRKEHFVGTLERKLDFIKGAIKTLTGKDMFVKVKVIGEEVAVRQPSATRASSGREAESAGRSAGGAMADEPGEPARPAPYRPYPPEMSLIDDSRADEPPRPLAGSSTSSGSAPSASSGASSGSIKTTAPPPAAKSDSKSEGKSEQKAGSKGDSKGEKKPWVPRSKDTGAWQSGGPKVTPDFSGNGENARGSDEILMVKEAYKLFEGPGSRFIG